MAGRPTLEEAVGIRRQILSAAMKEFSDRGFHGASIAGIAGRADVSRRTIYNHFQTKEQILEVLVEETSSQMGRKLADALAKDGPPWNVLFNIGMCFQEEAENPEERSISRILVMEAEHMPEMAQRGLAARRAILRPIADYLERMSLEGALSIGNADQAAQQFLHLTTGSLDYLFGEVSHSLEERRTWVANAVKTFLYGVGVKR